MRGHLSQQLFTWHVNTMACLTVSTTCFDPFLIKIGDPDMKVSQKSVHNLMNDFWRTHMTTYGSNTQSMPKCQLKDALPCEHHVNTSLSRCSHAVRTPL